MRLLVQHVSEYRYPSPAALGPHVVRLRPASHTRATIESYGLTIEPACSVHWQQDPAGNHVARLTFKEGDRRSLLRIAVEMAVDLQPVNPFDFFIEDDARQAPFTYAPESLAELGPYLSRNTPWLATGPLFDALSKDLPSDGDTLGLLVALNQALAQRVEYVIREESGIMTPEQTLAHKKASCRDSAVLMMALLRTRGLASRFVSGYLIQLKDEGLLPDVPRGMAKDVVDLHAWAEVFLPGAGWIGLDATSGLFCSEGHIPLAANAVPARASPLEGTSDILASDVAFETGVSRLGREARPESPYTESVWQDLVSAGERADARLGELGLALTIGGEPTFNARENPELPEWNTDALGEHKLALGELFALELKRKFAPNGLIQTRQGKQYPGETLPRWFLDVIWRADGAPLWSAVEPQASPKVSSAAAKGFAHALASRLGLDDFLLEAFEDPLRLIDAEARLPAEVDPTKADLDDPEERRRIARVLSAGLGSPAGYVLPLSRDDGKWRSSRWRFRRERLYLLWSDGPLGFRLPLSSLLPGEEPPESEEPEGTEADPRRAKKKKKAPVEEGVRTALTVQVRGDRVWVFVPPLASQKDFLELLEVIDAVRTELSIDAKLEGYAPPSGAVLRRLGVSPDPGVLEVNLVPSASTSEYIETVEKVFEAALSSGLHAEKYLLDGRQSGSGGGNHLTFGGSTATESPFVLRPDLLASLVTFAQNHPSLSYMFSGLFVGPTSQAPRLDEGRHDALYNLELTLARNLETASSADEDAKPEPWLSDQLFRHVLVDLTGSTHRSEICIDKLFDPQTPHGRQGLVELRAFEMPPHVRMAVAQMILVRSLLTAFAKAPYRAPLIRWGRALHDRMLLPYWMWTDFVDVLDYLSQNGLPLDPEAFLPFVEMRCPVVGRLTGGDVTLEIRNAVEPWDVLGEELTTFGTSRYVDSSMERLEVRARGLLPERHQILINGVNLPMHPTREDGEFVAGIRYRAWAPPHAQHPTLGIHHPLRIDVLDKWARRSLGACGYHVWHPQGRAFDSPPLTRFEAAARRSQRMTEEAPLMFPVDVIASTPDPEAPWSLDLRRFALDHPVPEPPEPEPEPHEAKAKD